MAVVFAYLISFSMAFLLFVVQPMATKVILPQFGGTPGVWNTAMLFFQTLLLFGYLYAHMLSTYLKPRWQIVTHGLLVMLACFALPVMFTAPAPEVLSNTPIRALISQLMIGVGLPFFCVSATAPLLQRWVSYGTTRLASKPYVLYSASNLGSMSALIGYILLIEPNAPVSMQMAGWGYLFALASLGLIVFAYFTSGEGEGAKPTAVLKHVSARQSGLWILLAFVPSSLSLGLTTHITTDIASVPFFWVVPFAIYLLSFVDAFADKPRLVPAAKRFAPLVLVTCLAATGTSFMMKETGMMLLHLAAFIFAAFAIHGHLADRKPAVTQLTWYYVCLSVGGALGGMFNAIIAPMVFNSVLEYALMLFIAALLSFLLLNPKLATKAELRNCILMTAMLLACAAVIYLAQAGFSQLPAVNVATLNVSLCLAALIVFIVRRTYAALFYIACVTFLIMFLGVKVDGTTLLQERNFYGVSRVFDVPAANARYLQHNTTIHGVQSHDPKLQFQPLSYYKGMAEIMIRRPVAIVDKPIAAIGLGVGTVKCGMDTGQVLDIFEINPLVVDIAENPDYFTYLSNCWGTHKIVLGDGRLTMTQMPDAKYGTIIIDAFSSDAIPVHLLTKEAFEMYLSKLKPGGVIALHITNRHLDLRPLIAAQAEAVGLKAYMKVFDANTQLVFGAAWVVLARDAETLQWLLSTKRGWEQMKADPDTKLWTDDYTNILPYLRKMK